jgi:ADP-dependent NAD(P)H-hydrate dehydratase / NAD(P)H-hydrate epimerase
MSQDYWQRQSGEPLFPDLLWSRPETRQGAGKLLIIGGQAQEFANVAECYSATDQAGAGTIRVLMPDSTRKATGFLPNVEYAPSTQSGSFARGALDPFLEASHWADGVLLAGDLGKNSETGLALEKFFNEYAGPLCITLNARASLSIGYKDLLSRPRTILIFTLSDLQKTAAELSMTEPITSSITNPKLAGILHEISSDYPADFLCLHNRMVWVTATGRVSSANLGVSDNALASTVAVWAIQNPTKTFEAATAALFSLQVGYE